MIAKLRQLLRTHLGAGEGAREVDGLELGLATATLLMEVARADSRISEEERQTVRRLIERHFSLPPASTREIMTSAEHESRYATSLYPFTRLINRTCSPEEKVQIIGMLWQVTCADGHVDKYEEYLVRKIADLLYVPHRDYIRMKLEVTDGPSPESPCSPGGDGALVSQEK